ncbi:MAG: 30S ribosomal protein S4 [Bacillota bacterium]
MARYTKAVCRQCRREGGKLFLKGEKCYTPKCPVDKRNYPPGEHGQGRKKVSEYGIQLREKQKVRKVYGVLEAQFRRYFRKAEQSRGVTGEILLQLLERRLDNVVHRMGAGASRAEARQLVRHGHFTVNGKKVDVPSYLVKQGDIVAVKPKFRDDARMKELQEFAKGRSFPEWLEVDVDNMAAKVLRYPNRENIDIPVEEHLIVELYSR